MLRRRNLLGRLRDSFWALPALLVLAGLAAGLGMVQLDAALGTGLAERFPRALGAAAEGARGILSAIATSMVTVAGVVFSVTIVSLSLAANAYSPRVLRTFMHDRGTQAVFGVFLATFAYCLIVLRTVRGDENGAAFVPSLSVLGGIVLAFVGVGFLVYFIHHTASTIQVSSILGRIAGETREAIDRLFPEEMGEGERDGSEPEFEPGPPWRAIPARRSGYVVSVDERGLLDFARERGAVVRMERRVGAFAIDGQALASMRGGRAREDDADELDRLYVIGQQRNIDQDPGFGVQQIVDVALRALSPGINDTTTAIMCVDHLAALLVRLSRRRMPDYYRYAESELRVIALGDDFDGLSSLAFDALRRNAEANVAVLMHLLHAAEEVAAPAVDERRRRLVLGHVEAIRRTAARAVPDEADRAAVVARAGEIAARLG